jgi:hypothetical protein
MHGFPYQAHVRDVLPHHEAKKAQAVRDKIRAEAVDLPDDEAAELWTFLDNAEHAIADQRVRDNQLAIDWPTLANEIKDMIFAELAIHDGPIVPFVSYPGDSQKEQKRKYELGGNFASVSKSAQDEILPFILSQNTFEVNTYLPYYLGPTRASRERRGAMLRKVTVSYKPGRNALRSLALLTHLEECTIVGRGQDWTNRRISRTQNPVNVAKQDFLRQCDAAVLQLIQNYPRADFRIAVEYQDHVLHQAVAVGMEVRWNRATNSYVYSNETTNHYDDATPRYMPLV